MTVLYRTALRVGAAVLTLAVVITVVFFALHLLRGGYATVYLGPTATPDQVDALNHQYGLDAPLLVQLGRWVGGLTRGDIGFSLVSGQPISTVLALRLPVTVELAVLALLLVLLVGIPLGTFLGTSSTTRRTADGFRAASALAVSLPDFVVGSVLVYLLTRFLPTSVQIGSYTALASDPARNLQQMIFPALTLSLFPTAVLVRTLRDSVRSVMAEPHVQAAVLRGETRREVITRHVLRNASLPALAVTTVSFGYLLGGAVIVETVFGLPGLGQALVDSINLRDYGVVQACVLFGAAAFIGVSVITESLTPLIDPRLRVQAH